MTHADPTYEVDGVIHYCVEKSSCWTRPDSYAGV